MPSTENKASLGCGTLILIALIVMIFGNTNRGADKKSVQRLDKLQSDVNSLKTDIQKQNDMLEKINRSLDEITKVRALPRPRVIAPASSHPQSPTPEAPLPEN